MKKRIVVKRKLAVTDLPGSAILSPEILARISELETLLGFNALEALKNLAIDEANISRKVGEVSDNMSDIDFVLRECGEPTYLTMDDEGVQWFKN